MVSCSSFTGCPLMYQKANPWGTITETNCSKEFWYYFHKRCTQSKTEPFFFMLDWVFAHDLSQDISLLAIIPSHPSDFQICQIHIACITKIPFKWELLTWRKKRFFRVESTFNRNFNQFLCPICQKEVLPKIALCCNDLSGASFSAC